jgi:hypothetical protein
VDKESGRSGLEKVAPFIVRSEQAIDAGAQGEVVPTLAIEERGLVLRLRDFQRRRGRALLRARGRKSLGALKSFAPSMRNPSGKWLIVRSDV